MSPAALPVWLHASAGHRRNGRPSDGASVKRFEPAAFFFGGVMWDAATLRRIDALVDNLLLGAYVVVLGVRITGAVLVQADRTTNRHLVKHRSRDTATAAIAGIPESAT